ncbi:MAG: hypothetical protein ACC661_01445, partial [Verrucomicrobiales bacterium]
MKAIAPRSRERGAALVIALVVLLLMSVIVTGFVVTMRTELGASQAIESSRRAELMAHSALSHAIELLRSNIPEPAAISETASSAPAQAWVTNPGRLSLVSPGGSLTHIALHSGIAATAGSDRVGDARSVDLNKPLPGHVRAPIAANPDPSGARPEMRVKWLPVLEDPGRPAEGRNRMVGRYAFWIDDESSRLNVSTALGKPAPGDPGVDGTPGWHEQMEMGLVTPRFQLGVIGNPPRRPYWSLGHPGSVNLDVLFDARRDVDLLGLFVHQYTHGFHRFPNAILRFVNLDPVEARKWYDANLWNMTFYSRAPEFNVFGRSRLFTTRDVLPLEGGPAYQGPFSYQGNLQMHALLGLLPSRSSNPSDL